MALIKANLSRTLPLEISRIEYHPVKQILPET